MARTIGTKSITLIKKLTRQIKAEGFENIEDRVIEKLSIDLWDKWEGADSEIRRIISDTMFDIMFE